MFGDEFAGNSRGLIRVCCGAHCGAHPGHGRIYAAIERIAAGLDDPITVLPAVCQGYCGLGVTLVMPGGEATKIREPNEARAKILMFGEEF